MGNMNSDNLVKLQCTFPKLTDTNQQYVLGLAEGLKHAQEKIAKLQDKNMEGNNMRTILKTVFFIMLVFFSSNLLAQENEETDEKLHYYFNTELFYWTSSMFGGLSLNLNNQSSSISFGITQSMKEALLSYPDSSREYNSYKQKNNTGNILLWVGTAIYLGGIMFFVFKDNTIHYDDYGNATYSDPNYHSNTIISASMIGSGFISVIVSAFISSSGTQNLLNSVNLYNNQKIMEYK
jgi:heme/copper-type cytochrome/quinol oxidase subunit 2